MIGRRLTGTMMAAAMLAAPAGAGVKEGIDAWQRGDYAAAVAQWKPAAAAGDADAEFNLAQAYKLGRGVPADLAQAQALYYKAAQQGHPQAEANYGLILFQNGDRAGAMPWLQKAAALGEPRAQYVVGTALFNGDLAGKDWPRAYAFMTRAAAAGLPQAASSLAEMDRMIPAGDRQRGVALARSIAAPTPVQPGSGEAPVPSASGSAFAATGTPTGTPGIATASLPPSSVADDQTALASPPPQKGKKAKKGAKPAGEEQKVVFAQPTPSANFGPDDTSPPAEAPAAAAAPVAVAPAATPSPPAPAPAPKKSHTPAAKPVAPAPAPGGKWRVQLGAYSSPAGANAAWKTIAHAGGLGGLEHFAVAAGKVTRLQAGPFATREAAAKACASAKTACFAVAAP